MPQSFNPQDVQKIGVLLCNFGSPKALNELAVKKYIKQVLSDKHIVKQSWYWKILLNTCILPLRTHRILAEYKKIWMYTGSPLNVYSYGLARVLKQTWNWQDSKLETAVGVLYPESNLELQLNALYERGVEEIVALPMFPYYSKTTSAVIDETLVKYPKVKIIKDLCKEDLYVDCLTQHIRRHLRDFHPEALLISYHSMPVKYIKQGDPYQELVLQTSAKLREKLRADCQYIRLVYQSRFGFGHWLQPDINDVLDDLAKQGIKRVAVVSPSFMVDCLETLYDLKEELKQNFEKNEGAVLHYIPCLNAEKSWSEALVKIIRRCTAVGSSDLNTAMLGNG